MAKEFAERFGEWQNYVHYLLLTIIISAIASYYGAPFDWKMFGILFLTIFVGDTIIHGIFWVLPKPYQWRD